LQHEYPYEGKSIKAMAKPLFILVGTQCLFTLSDVMGRTYMARHGFRWSTFISLWFLAYTLVRQLATFGQVYIFANIQLGKTMAMFGAVSIVLSNVVGLLYLGEKISPVSYFGIFLAILAFIVMGFK
jgi:hypothetical protein